MKRGRKQDNSDDGGGSATQFLTLSLFIMLLAFFIVLTASSSTDRAKSAPLIESLEKTFATKLDGGRERPARIKDMEEAEGQGQALENIKGLLRSQGLPFTIEKSEGNSLMYLRIRLDDLVEKFGLNTERLTREQSIFVSKLLVLMRPSDAVLTYKMDVFLGVGGNPADMALSAPDRVRSAVVTSDKLATTLLEQGFSKKLISVGLHKGAAGYVDLHFTPLYAEERS